MLKASGHTWRFKARFRRHAFGWRSQPAIARLREAVSDQIPYIERLADCWGELCGSIEIASAWADRLIGLTRLALSPDKNLHGYFHGTTACLSALFAAQRYDELIELVKGDIFWPYKRWAVKAMVAQGRNVEAIAYAESCRHPWASNRDIDGQGCWKRRAG